MPWELTDDPTAFLDAAGGFLTAYTAENNLLLTVTDAVRTEGTRTFGEQSPWYGWWRPGPGAEVAGACLRTPPLPVVLGRMPEAAAGELAAVLAERDGAPGLPGGVTGAGGVNGAVAAGEAFAAGWREVTGAEASVRRRERLYRLSRLTGPDPAPSGTARRARPEERDLLVGWFEAFAREVGERTRDYRAGVESRTARGGLWLWEDGGRPVAMAATSAQAAGMVRVGPVYTPPEVRRRGYAAGATAAAADDALARGAREVLLFTDLANPTSNALYQRLGFLPVSDRVVLAFPSGG